MNDLGHILFSLVITLFTNYAFAQTLIGVSENRRVQVIELYSSESCSSCPPADKWISTLKDKDGLWKKFIPIVFHVDYWNHLNWKDGLSSDLMTKRQVDMAGQWPSPNVYTPGVIVNGIEWTKWRSGLLPTQEEKSDWKIAVYQETSGTIKVTFDSSKKSDANKKFILRVAKLGMGLSTNVTAGENAGSVLKHDFVVLDWNGKEISLAQKELKFQFKISNKKTTRVAVVAWIEEVGNLSPIQAAGGYL